MNTIKCYCDASFCPERKVAVCGWKIGNNDCFTKVIHNTNNTRAEYLAILDLLNHIDKINQYIIYTDCQGIINTINKKDKLISKNFRNKKGEDLANGDLYKLLFTVLENHHNISIVFTPGHMPSKLMNIDNQMFSQVDKLIRKELRIYLSQQ